MAVDQLDDNKSDERRTGEVPPRTTTLSAMGVARTQPHPTTNIQPSDKLVTNNHPIAPTSDTDSQPQTTTNRIPQPYFNHTIPLYPQYSYITPYLYYATVPPPPVYGITRSNNFLEA